MEFLQIMVFLLFIALVCTNAGALLFVSTIITMIFWEIAGNQISNVLNLNSEMFFITSVILTNYVLFKVIDKKIKNKNIQNFA